MCVLNTESCTIFAVEAATGKQLWSFWLGDPLTSAPTIAEASCSPRIPRRPPRTARAAGRESRARRVRSQDRQDQWQLWLDGDVMSAPVAVGEFLYVSTFAGTVIKVEQKTGKVRYAMKAKATSAPVVQFDNGRRADVLHAPRRGESRRRASAEMIIRADHNEPVTKYKAASKKAGYIDGKVQARARTRRVEGGRRGERLRRWRARGGGGRTPRCRRSAWAACRRCRASRARACSDLGDRNVNTMGDEVIATDRETGSTLWKYKLAGDQAQGGFLGTAPLAGRRVVLLGTLEGKVLKLDPKTGTPTAVYTVGAPVRSQPVVDSGWIYVGTEDGKLVAINTGDAQSPAGRLWGGNAQRTGVAQR